MATLSFIPKHIGPAEHSLVFKRCAIQVPCACSMRMSNNLMDSYSPLCTGELPSIPAINYFASQRLGHGKAFSVANTDIIVDEPKVTDTEQVRTSLKFASTAFITHIFNVSHIQVNEWPTSNGNWDNKYAWHKVGMMQILKMCSDQERMPSSYVVYLHFYYIANLWHFLCLYVVLLQIQSHGLFALILLHPLFSSKCLHCFPSYFSYFISKTLSKCFW